jgi:hypothetical protein
MGKIYFIDNDLLWYIMLRLADAQGIIPDLQTTC